MIVIDFIIEVISYTTARLMLPLLTFGKVKVESPSSAKAKFNWLGFTRLSNGVLLCEAPLAGWIGLIPWVLVIILVTIFV
jgi:hypothetical protein